MANMDQSWQWDMCRAAKVAHRGEPAKPQKWRIVSRRLKYLMLHGSCSSRLQCVWCDMVLDVESELILDLYQSCKYGKYGSFVHLLFLGFCWFCFCFFVDSECTVIHL